MAIESKPTGHKASGLPGTGLLQCANPGGPSPFSERRNQRNTPPGLKKYPFCEILSALESRRSRMGLRPALPVQNNSVPLKPSGRPGNRKRRTAVRSFPVPAFAGAALLSICTSGAALGNWDCRIAADGRGWDCTKDGVLEQRTAAPGAPAPQPGNREKAAAPSTTALRPPPAAVKAPFPGPVMTTPKPAPEPRTAAPAPPLPSLPEPVPVKPAAPVAAPVQTAPPS